MTKTNGNTPPTPTRTMREEYEFWRTSVFGVIDSQLDEHLRRAFASGVIVGSRIATERGREVFAEACAWAMEVA